MDYHPGRLVDDKHIVILVDYVQRNVFRKDFQSTPLVRHHECDNVSRPDDAVRFRNPVVHPNIVLPDCALDAMPRGVFHMGGQIFVHPHRTLSLVYLETEMFEHLLFLIGECHLISGYAGIEIIQHVIPVYVAESVLCFHFCVFTALSFDGDFRLRAWRYLAPVCRQVQGHG